MRRSYPLRSAPGILGAFALALISSSCKKDSAPWEGSSIPEESAAAVDSAPEAKPPEEPAAPAVARDPDAPSSLRFVSYNVENWLTMERYVDRKPAGSSEKPESERQAVVEIISRANPDVLGLCEIGTEADLADLQSRLKAAGIDLPHSHHTGGADDTRRLGLLSKLPITSSEIHKNLSYEDAGVTRQMGRGILDVTVQVPGGDVRFLGTHLKSKREIPDGDQEMMRRAEAHLLRQQVDRILDESSDARLIVYGDMNDTRQASAIRTLMGPRNSPRSLKMAYLKDSRGESWTHFWSYQDVYSRFDYVFVTPPLLDEVLWDECRVLDDPEWGEASDHRALLFILK